VVIRKDPNQIIVDIGSKREGVVPASDLQKLGREFVEQIQVGDEVPVYIVKPEGREGDVIVSINMARQARDWERARELKQTEELFEGKVIGFNKGGLLVGFGSLQGFIPRSHIVDLSKRTDPNSPQDPLSQMVGQEIPLKVIEVDQRKRRLILSERAAWREWRETQKERLIENLQVGDVRKGTVTSLAKFGAFVDLGGADGLIHITELSWDRGKKPEDVLQVGQEVEVKVIHVDRERRRIGLSLKQLTPDPWETIEERYAIGQYVDVEITNLTKFGAFARLEEGVEGLIHISELADSNVQHPSQVVRPGQMVTVQIINLDGERRRVGLSLRRVPEHLRTPFEEEAREETTEEAAGEHEAVAETEAVSAEPDIEVPVASPAEEPDVPAIAEAEEGAEEAAPDVEGPPEEETTPAVRPAPSRHALSPSSRSARDEAHHGEEPVELPVADVDEQVAPGVNNGDEVAQEAEPAVASSVGSEQ
jgi:small subunit ribosomal protein S1